MPITKDDLKVGAIYRANRPSKLWNGVGLAYNDREIIHMDGVSIQYDGPAVRLGQRYPKISIERFLKWAAHEVAPDQQAS